MFFKLDLSVQGTFRTSRAYLTAIVSIQFILWRSALPRCLPEEICGAKPGYNWVGRRNRRILLPY
jgi:hypothetical protein